MRALLPARPLLAALAATTLGCTGAPPDDSGDPPPPPDPCADAVPATEAALRARFRDEVWPLLLRPAVEGGCAECHTPETTHDMVLWEDDPDRSMDALWSSGRLSWRTTPGTLLGVLPEDAPIRMPLGAAVWPPDDVAVLQAFTCDLAASELTPPDICAAPDPGHTPLRRLSGAEYDATVAALTGESRSFEGVLIPDTLAHGFSNNHAGQVTSPGHLQAYQDAAEAIAGDTLFLPRPLVRTFEAEELPATLAASGAPMTNPGHGGPREDAFHFQRIRADVSTGQLPVVFGGTYRVEVVARGHDGLDRQRIDGELVVVDERASPELRVVVDGQEMDRVPVEGAFEAFGPWRTLTFEVPIPDRPVEVKVGLANASWGRNRQRDVELQVDRIEVSGPRLSELPPIDPERLDRFLICEPSEGDCAARTVDNALTTLWRRPASPDEVDRYLPLITDTVLAGHPFEEGVRLVLEAGLLSPHFLYRVEPDPSAAAEPVPPHALASRLSYLIWSAPPDAALLAAAEDGSLADPEVLRAHTERLLDDPRSRALTDRFAAEWLQLPDMEHMTFSADALPAFDEPLRRAMIEEIRLVFQDVLDEDRPVSALLVRDTTFVNDRLAAHYGLAPPGTGEAFAEIPTDGTPRGGLLTAAGFLALTSHPAKTSPTRRGRWIQQNLLCQPPAEPPPDVETSVDPPEGAPQSLREVLAVHRTEPACAACHAMMDPLGLSLEHFDPLGRWRSTDDFGMPVDASAELPVGATLDGHEGLTAWVSEQRAFEKCVVQKLTLHATGREPASLDRCLMADLERAFAEDGHTLRGLIHALVQSPLFRERRAERPGEHAHLTGEE
jgi:hypothetical protein